jgi:hypothetical protein
MDRQKKIMNKRIKAVAKAWNARERPSEAAAKIGISLAQYHRAVRFAKDAGLTVAREKREGTSYNALISRLNDQGSKIGSIGKIIIGLDKETRGWLLNQIPEKGTAAELITTMINDAFDEENG